MKIQASNKFQKCSICQHYESYDKDRERINVCVKFVPQWVLDCNEGRSSHIVDPNYGAGCMCWEKIEYVCTNCGHGLAMISHNIGQCTNCGKQFVITEFDKEQKNE